MLYSQTQLNLDTAEPGLSLEFGLTRPASVSVFLVTAACLLSLGALQTQWARGLNLFRGRGWRNVYCVTAI